MTNETERSEEPRPERLQSPLPEQVGAWVEHAFKTGAFHLEGDFDLAKRPTQRIERSRERAHSELPFWVDPNSLRQAGWGVIVLGNRQIYLDHLRPLLRRRELQAGSKMYHEYKLQRGQSAEDFFRKKHETPGTIDPKKVPYYLLIVGSPREIPFEFQYHLSLSHAVGRVWFPTLDGYRSYARAVCRAETEGVERPRKVTVFAVESDPTTRTIGKTLVPSALRLIDGFPSWEIEIVRREEAVKSRLGSYLGGGETPGLLLVSAHGRSPRNEGSRSRDLTQGALLCEPAEDSRPEDLPVLFSAADLAAEPEDLHGLIGFFFADHSAGTPVLDNFPHTGEGQGLEAAIETSPRVLGKEPRIARLPVDLLSRGALAVLGHIDRGWTTSFAWGFKSGDLGTLYCLEDTLSQLLRGQRLGHALRPFNRRYSQFASRLAQMLDLNQIGGHVDLARLGLYWTAINEARNFVTLGDPAVYLLGKRPGDTVIRLEPRQLERIERLALSRRMSVNEWMQTTIDHALDKPNAASETTEVLTLPKPTRSSKTTSPSALLRPEYGIVPFHGRERELTTLGKWCQEDQILGVRLLTGPGGIGKTRLALELCESQRENGWQAGFVSQQYDLGLPEVVDAVLHQDSPVLAVIDYAETRRKLLPALLQRLLTHRGHPLRLLLLSRAALDWWEHLKSEGQGIGELLTGPLTAHITLPPLAFSLEDRKRYYRIATEAFAKVLDKDAPDEPPDDLAVDDYESVLYLHMRALIALEGSESKEPLQGEALLDQILAQERRRWRLELEKHRLPAELLGALARAVAVITLGGGVMSEKEALEVLGSLSHFDDQPRDSLANLAGLLHKIYPGRARWIGPLQPDPLGEHLIQRELENDPTEILDLVFGSTHSPSR